VKKRELERRRRAHSIALMELGVAGLVFGLWAFLTGYLFEGERSVFSHFAGPILLVGSFYVLIARFKREPMKRRRPDQQAVVLAHVGVVTLAVVGSSWSGWRAGPRTSSSRSCICAPRPASRPGSS
jgi:ABC-type transport system involved in cytochrome c biogenesis permease subunit